MDTCPDFGNLDANLQFLDDTGILHRGQRILEIGSGRGTLLQTLRERGLDVRGVDVSADRIAEARARYPDLPVQQTSGVALPFPDASMDVVLSFDVIEHIPDVDAHLREVRRVLAPGGWYLLQTPNKWTNTIFETIRWRSFTRWREDHCSLHTYDQLERRFRSHGFTTRFADVRVVTPFYRAKVRQHLGALGSATLAIVNPDRLPQRLRTNFYLVARAPGGDGAGGRRVSTSDPITSDPGGLRETVVGSDEEFLEAAYWIVLGRALDAEWRKVRMRHFELGHTRDSMLRALLGSSEFRERFIRAQEAADQAAFYADDPALESGLASLGTARAFVQACYLLLLGRDADEAGAAYYASQIEARRSSRRVVVWMLLRSDEFADRYKVACPSGGLVPSDVQLCELANPAKWDNLDWLLVLRGLKLPAERKLAMHRKAYEFTQTAWGLGHLGALTEDAHVLSVGAGHESLAYWLANRVKLVIATDLYPGEWESSAGSEGDARVLTHPQEFAPFPYRTSHLRFLRMDGRRLAFGDGTFDVAYSLSSIEHFGGWAGAREAMQEMARVLRPGGLLVLATEWHLAGPPRPSEDVFEPEEVRRLVDLPSLELVEPIDDRVWQRYTARPVDLRLNRHETPHMLVEIDGTVFTSVMVFLRKKTPGVFSA